MRLINILKKTVIYENIIEPRGLLEHIFGLIFYKNPVGMILWTRFGIHTFFMKYPIDVVILDNKMSVVNMSRDLRPNSVFFWNPKYKFVLELPAGSIMRSRTEIGDRIKLEK